MIFGHTAIGARRAAQALAVALLPLALVACGPKSDADRNLDSLDAELSDADGGGDGVGARARDPALLSALQDQIMVDPALASSANHDAIRPPAAPYAAPVAPEIAMPKGANGDVSTSEVLKSAPAADPAKSCESCAAAQSALTLGGLAARQRSGNTRACAASIDYSTRWALRLPRDLPLYPDARVREAAGTQNGQCRLRVVSFTTAAPLQSVIDWYYTRASNAGYSADHQADGDQHVLAGTRGDAAYAVFVSPRAEGGSDVDLVANNGE